MGWVVPLLWLACWLKQTGTRRITMGEANQSSPSIPLQSGNLPTFSKVTGDLGTGLKTESDKPPENNCWTS